MVILKNTLRVLFLGFNVFNSCCWWMCGYNEKKSPNKPTEAPESLAPPLVQPTALNLDSTRPMLERPVGIVQPISVAPAQVQPAALNLELRAMEERIRELERREREHGQEQERQERQELEQNCRIMQLDLGFVNLLAAKNVPQDCKVLKCSSGYNMINSSYTMLLHGIEVGAFGKRDASKIKFINMNPCGVNDDTQHLLFVWGDGLQHYLHVTAFFDKTSKKMVKR